MERQQKKQGDEWPERVLVRLAVFLCAALVLTQLILFNEKPRQYLSQVDRLEGEKISLNMPVQQEPNPLLVAESSVVTNRFQSMRESRILLIRMVYPAPNGQALVLVNGQILGRFERSDVRVKVYDGDYVEIDATKLHEPGRFVVKVPSDGLSSPEDGLMLEGSNKVITVGKVKFKS